MSHVSPAERRRGVMLSLCAALCSAIYLFPYKRAAEFAPAHVLAFALLSVAAALSLALWFWERRGTRLLAARHERGLVLRTALVLSLATISGNFCGAQAVARLDPALNSLLLRTEVVFVGCLGALLLHEAITRALALGAGLALLGLGVMSWPFTSGSFAGAAWCLGAAASFGLMQVLTRRVITRISPTSVNMLRLWLAVGMLACVPHTLRPALALGAQFWWFVAAAALLGPVAGRLLIMHSLRGLRAAESALLLLMAPVFAFSLGYLVWGDTPSLQQALGSATMLVGIALPLLSAAGVTSRQGRAGAHDLTS